MTYDPFSGLSLLLEGLQAGAQGNRVAVEPGQKVYVGFQRVAALSVMALPRVRAVRPRVRRPSMRAHLAVKKR